MSKEELLAEYEKIREQGELEASSSMAKIRKNVKDSKLKNLQKIFKNLRDDLVPFKVENFIEEEASVQEKYSQRFYDNLTNIIDSVKPPEQITLRTLETYLDTLKEMFQQIDEVSRKYVKLFDRQFQSRVKAIDRSYRRLIKEVSKFSKFVEKDYAPQADKESLVWYIDDLRDLTLKYYNLIDQIKTHEPEIISKSGEIIELQKKLDELENHPKRDEYQTVIQEYSKTQKKLDDYLSDVRKALRKYINIKSKSKDNIDLSLMKELVSDAAGTIAEQNNTGAISQLLREINNLLENNELELKRERKDAAKESITKLLEGELNEIWKETRSFYQKKISLKEELDKLDLDSEIHRIINKIDASNRDRLRIIEREIREAENIKKEIEKLITTIDEKFRVIINNNLDEIPTFGVYEA
jgi:hypothetical protein